MYFKCTAPIYWCVSYNNEQILHATMLDIKVYYYPRNAIFHEATGRVVASWNIANLQWCCLGNRCSCTLVLEIATTNT